MITVAVVVIFGVEHGSGHLVRMTRLIDSSSNACDLYALVDNDNDAIKAKMINDKVTCITNLDQICTKYDMVIWDDLGIYIDPKTSNTNIALDPVNATKTQLQCLDRSYSVNYFDQGHENLPEHYRSKLFIDEKKLAVVLQGGGDDHRTIPEIIDVLVEEYYVIAMVNMNCRHIDSLKEFYHNDRSSVMVNGPIRKICESSDLIVCSGGNALFELQGLYEKMILFSMEEKEHLTFSSMK